MISRPRSRSPLLSPPVVVFIAILVALPLIDFYQTKRVERLAGDNAALADAVRFERFGTWIEGVGRVHKILPDDTEGDKHQRFILEWSEGQTVLIVHNIDLAPRIPIEIGDEVRFRGEYAWNDKGGLVHWTHYDPSGQRPGGWLETGGETYR